MDKKKAVVVVPVYQKELNKFEQISLRRCLSVLKNHPIVAISPKSLDTQFLRDECGIEQVEYFDDHYFKGLMNGYNRLMLSTEFYERFLNYEYMLIHQLDVYVFEDKLNEWCNKGYDYVGAPWIPKAKYNIFYHKIALKIYQFISRIFDSYGARCNYFFTGNGGFSLRKTEKLYNITKTDRESIDRFVKNSYAEDVFWSVYTTRKNKQFRIPNYLEAIPFAFENHPKDLYKINNNQLPFGTHAWYKEYKLKFWEKFIPELHK